jgi:DNA-binding MarR family transcriptional regulator
MQAKKAKSARKLERHFKGVANHRRIEILLFVQSHDSCSLDDIVGALRGNMKTVSEHTRRLVIAGLIEKSYSGRTVEHRLTPYGEIFCSFIRDFGNLSLRAK